MHDQTITKHSCDPQEIALKSFFLGPQGENADWLLPLVDHALRRWVSWRRALYPNDGAALSPQDQASPEFAARVQTMRETLDLLLTRFEDEVPKFSPRYIGHMFSETSLPALLGHVVTLLHNPNNISGEASRVGVQIEREAIAALARMVGFDPHLSVGHFTSGGTIANLESLVRSRARISRENEGEGQVSSRVILVPENMHYSWKKGVRLLGMGDASLWPIALDRFGHLSLESLERLLVRATQEKRVVQQVVSVVGSTELGGVDPVDGVQNILDRWRAREGVQLWHHVDAAYGGFLCCADLDHSEGIDPAACLALKAISRADSVTLDPHKLGYVPYASGAFLTREAKDYYFATGEEAPYLDFDATRDRGPYTIEGSRSAAGAVATWMTAQTMGLNAGGYGLLIERTVRVRRELAAGLVAADFGVRIAPGCDTNVLCFTIARAGEPLSVANQRCMRIYEALSPQARGAFIVSKTEFSWATHDEYLREWTSEWRGARDESSTGVVLIRLTLMNPFFSSLETRVDYSEELIQTLQALASE